MKAGREQLIVPLASVAALRRAQPEPQALQKLHSEDGASMAYVFAMAGAGAAEARFFFQQGPAVLEDPATGSATANFGGWCLAMQRTLPLELQISQGEAVGRPSMLYLRVTAEREIQVGGDVIELGRGSIKID